MNNTQYADILDSIATLRQIRGDSPFKSRAYENAARLIRKMPEEVEDLIEQGIKLTTLDGIGKSLSAELHNINDSGESPMQKELLANFPDGILELTRVEGLGPKRIKLLYDELQICDLASLEVAAEAGLISALPGLGQKTEDKIKSEIIRLKITSVDRIPLPLARAAGESIVDALKKLDCIEKIEIAGSIRRGRETSKDIDILVAAKDATIDHELIFDTFLALKEVDNVLVRGETKTSVRLKSGTQVDVRIVETWQFGAALHYFTGSKEHNIAIRSRAKKMGLRINEYGVLRLEDEEYIASKTEEDIFAAIGLPWIAPELREGGNEIEDGLNGTLPDLIDHTKIQGDLHMHTTESDGRNSIAEMVEKAKSLGYNYIAITDHSAFVPVTGGMNADSFAAQIEAVREENEKHADFTVLAGIEVDILSDGSLDMDDHLLSACDWVVGSIHSGMNMKKENMTERLLKAMHSGHLNAFGHPTGRILGGRKGYDYDLDLVAAAAIQNRVAFEMNGSTGRLDLNAAMAKRVSLMGAMIVLGSDAHSTRGMDEMRYAIQQSRRAELPASKILNSLSAEALLEATR